MGIPQSSLEKINIHELTRKAASGEVAAFEQLYQLFFPRISRFVSFRVAHRESAEDVISGIFIKAWESLQGGSSIASFHAWIYTVARNAIIDYYRGKREFIDLTELENYLEYDDNVVDAVNLDYETREFLQALSALKPDQQQVIRLKFVEDLDNEEIAAVTGKSSGAIRVIQHRAITALKKLIKPRS